MIVLGKFGERIRPDCKYTIFNGNEFVGVYGNQLLRNIDCYDNLRPVLINSNDKDVHSAVIQSIGSDAMLIQNGSIIVIKNNDIVLLWTNGFTLHCENCKGVLSEVYVSDYRLSLYIGTNKKVRLTKDGDRLTKGVHCVYFNRMNFSSALRLVL